jgi:hypothetical protein
MSFCVQATNLRPTMNVVARGSCGYTALAGQPSEPARLRLYYSLEQSRDTPAMI